MGLLMGALGGLGKGMAEVGTMKLKEEAEMRRQANLERISNSQYDRSRTDKLSDVKSSQDYQATLTQEQRDLDAKTLTEQRIFDEGVTAKSNKQRMAELQFGVNNRVAAPNQYIPLYLKQQAKLDESLAKQELTEEQYSDASDMLRRNYEPYMGVSSSKVNTGGGLGTLGGDGEPVATTDVDAKDNVTEPKSEYLKNRQLLRDMDQLGDEQESKLADVLNEIEDLASPMKLGGGLIGNNGVGNGQGISGWMPSKNNDIKVDAIEQKLQTAANSPGFVTEKNRADIAKVREMINIYRGK